MPAGLELLPYWLLVDLHRGNQNQIFIILAVLRRSVLRVGCPISTAYRLDNTAPKKRRSGD